MGGDRLRGLDIYVHNHIRMLRRCARLSGGRVCKVTRWVELRLHLASYECICCKGIYEKGKSSTAAFLHDLNFVADILERQKARARWSTP